jgi:hypothetical protein
MSDRPLRHFIGLDIAPFQEFTALAVLERPWISLGESANLRRPV